MWSQCAGIITTLMLGLALYADCPASTVLLCLSICVALAIAALFEEP